ncbi:chemotaxis protein CheW [Bacillus sp. MUM 13]|uniref:chemotaxis protein CheW n=1 Tax=Bacillus sp. MUM 13 TaxID=1678001 RepID=UPI0008F5ADCD|nr:chemotaxis protein CheW [Bacillus sp. MUM 13]OIK09314.1 hypothetical protein BIV59_17345 [Bacillus sp. MUM 13]
MKDSQKIVVITSGEEEFGLPIETVQSIEKPVSLTAIPHFSDAVEGMAAIRDTLIPMISIQKVLFPHKKPSEKQGKWILLNTDGMAIGLIADDAREILDIADEQIKIAGFLGYQKTKYITGVADLGEGRLISIIDPQVLCQSIEGISGIEEYILNQQSG